MRGKIATWDPVDGLGDVELSDGSRVRFGASALRDFRRVPLSPGLEVEVDEVRPGFRGAPRAGVVRLAEASWDRAVSVVGLSAPRTVAGVGRERLRLLPFDPSRFPGLEAVFREEVVASLSFSPPSPPRPAPPSRPELEALLAAASTLARPAFCFRASGGDAPGPGATFAFGDFADLGGTSFPEGPGGGMAHLLQVGAEDARRLGIDGQVNVFVGQGSLARSSTFLAPDALVRHLFAEQEARVVVSRGGARRRGKARPLAPAAALEFFGEARVLPGYAELARGHALLGLPLPSSVAAFFGGVFELVGPEFDEVPALRSVQATFGAHLPGAADLARADLVLGGFAASGFRPSTPSGPLRRLAALRVVSFPWLSALREGFERLAVDLDLTAGPSAYLHGAP